MENFHPNPDEAIRWSVLIRPGDIYQENEALLAPSNQWAVPLGRTGVGYREVGVIWNQDHETPRCILTLPKSCKIVYRISEGSGRSIPVMLVVPHEQFGMTTCTLCDLTGVMRDFPYPYDLFAMPFNFSSSERLADPWKDYLHRLQDAHILFVQDSHFMLIWHKVDTDCHPLPAWDRPTWWLHAFLLRLQGDSNSYRVWRNSWCRSCKIERYDNPTWGVGMAVITVPGWAPGPGDWDVINTQNVLDLDLHDGLHHAHDELVLVVQLEPQIDVTDDDDDEDEADVVHDVEHESEDEAIDVAPGDVQPGDAQFGFPNVDGAFDASLVLAAPQAVANEIQEQFLLGPDDVQDSDSDSEWEEASVSESGASTAPSEPLPGDIGDHHNLQESENDDNPELSEVGSAMAGSLPDLATFDETDRLETEVDDNDQDLVSPHDSLPLSFGHHSQAYHVAAVRPITRRSHTSLGVHHSLSALIRGINQAPGTPRSRSRTIAFVCMALRPSLPRFDQPQAPLAPVPTLPSTEPGYVALEESISHPGLEMSGVEPLPLSSGDASMVSLESRNGASQPFRPRPLSLLTETLAAALEDVTIGTDDVQDGEDDAQAALRPALASAATQTSGSTLPDYDSEAQVSASDLYLARSSEADYDDHLSSVFDSGEEEEIAREA
jgi:hypothetical protein